MSTKATNPIQLLVSNVIIFDSNRLCDYEVALRDVLHFRKNLKREEWRAIGIHISNRKRQAKESEVIWNNIPFEAKKVRKELLRNSQPKSGLIRKVNPELPPGLVIRTPPRSPATYAAVLLPSPESQLGNAPANSPQAVSGGSNHPINPSSVAGETIWEVQQALVKAGEFGVSAYRKLRENLPFNRCMSQLLYLSQSLPLHFRTPTAETWTPVFPRLFGANPSWELFGRQIFGLSNQTPFRGLSDDDLWFLKWVAISADFALLRAFFSINSPTAGVVYESLLGRARDFRMADLVRVLFELRHVLKPNNPASFNEAEFVRVAVQLGSRSDGILDIVKTCLSDRSPPSTTKHNKRNYPANSFVLTAACQCDIAMLRVLLDVSCQVEFHTYRVYTKAVGQIMSYIYNWDPQEEESLTAYIKLLLRGGILNSSASPHCSDDHRPQVQINAHTIWPITLDELIMLCPPMRRKHVQKTVMQLIADRGNCISRAGVFTAAQDGVLGLRAYIEANQKDNAFLTRVALEECLLFAAVVNDSKTTLGLLEVGVDPYVGLLSNNLEKYHKGILPWNPSIVAAAAGHLEVLTLLLSQINLSSFLDIAPIHELIHHKKLQEGYMGGELCRLNIMRQDYLREPWRLNPAVEGSLDRIEDCLIGSGRKWETLEYIRTIAHSSGSGQKIDLDIIEAAVFNNRKPDYWRRIRRLHLPSEVLLIEGLIDTHLEYEEDGMDMLQISIRNDCSFAVVRFLSDKGFKVHSRPGGRDHNTMLHDALLSKSPDRSDIVDFLLREGADCQFCGEGLTILEASLWNLPPFGMRHSSEYQRTFERLLDAGAPVYHFPQKRLSKWQSPIPLLFCLQPSDARDDLILRVVDAGPPLNDCGYSKEIYGNNMTPLQAAIICGNETIARELIRRGADVHAPAHPRFGFTALQAACLHEIPIHFLEYLVIVLGVDVDEPPAKTGGLTSLAGAVLQCSLNTVEFLSDHGADVNAACSFQANFKDNKHDLVRPLDFAAAFGSSDMVEFLLKAGGRSGKAGLGGSMGIAERQGHFSVLSVLRSWDKKHGRRILEDEALWQSRNPEQALLMYEAANKPCHSEFGDSEDDDDTDDGW